ncbi:type IV pili methyl-accepting chemotaxis transducer N-terminal domain-containing protein [Pseudomonas segetis]|uniref:Type IV pili methyl-accepting chemotaxis transducer N-term n=1 Tax=Pseudomonas segetis TaxID=298908 RepID=A0A239GM67_9PSED|nr:type IV pili methyl-accepting chemotaxis transducer N-terminal domain-containing protein [Pseudomonas segetis]SNS69975.1 Type IV pili methyl-accepting chemotaxis transducer N-term [Pseudomonas segetis]
MKGFMRALLLGCSLLISSTSWAQMATLEAMNMAGLQRSLGQIIAKDYMMIGSDVKVASAIRQRDESIALFEKHHQQLKDYATDEQSRASLAKVEAIWAEYKPLITAQPDKAQAPLVLATAEKLVKECQQTVDLLEKQNGDAASHAINRSGWNRVLTQRTAMFYMARAWGVTAPNLDAEFQASVKEFGSIMQELQASKAPNPEIAEALRKTDAKWQFASKALSSKDFVPTIVAINADSMFRQLNEMTRLYAGLTTDSL